MLSPAEDALVNMAIIGIISIFKASGMTEEQAKAEFQVKVENVEKLPQLPMDI